MPGIDRKAARKGGFREVSEHPVEAHRRMGDHADSDRMLEVPCECGRSFCGERVELTREEHERVRAEPTHFVLACGHETTLVERVVERTDRFLVVENEGRAAEVARAAESKRRSRRSS